MTCCQNCLGLCKENAMYGDCLNEDCRCHREKDECSTCLVSSVVCAKGTKSCTVMHNDACLDHVISMICENYGADCIDEDENWWREGGCASCKAMRVIEFIK